MWLYVVILIGTASYWYRKLTVNKPFDPKVRADGKVIIITGANNGIGKFVALSCAERGAKVIMACRNAEKAEKARRQIIEKSGNSNVHFRLLDVSSFKSVREFSKRILKEEPRIDVLVNNAGIFGQPRTLTEDGIESHMATNHFGHFLLTNLLLDRLKESTPSRVIAITSLAHLVGYIPVHDMNFDKYYNSFHIYSITKLANIMFTNHLSKILHGTGVTANSVHPGVTRSDISKDVSFYLMTKTMSSKVVKMILRMFFGPTIDGAQPILRLALDPEMRDVSGKYFCQYKQGIQHCDAKSDELCQWLWDYSMKVTGLAE